DDAAVSAGLELLLPEDGDLEFAGLGLGSHDLGIGLGVEVERGRVDQVAAPDRRLGDDGPGIVGGLGGRPVGATNGPFAALHVRAARRSRIMLRGCKPWPRSIHGNRPALPFRPKQSWPLAQTRALSRSNPRVTRGARRLRPIPVTLTRRYPVWMPKP